MWTAFPSKIHLIFSFWFVRDVLYFAQTPHSQHECASAAPTSPHGKTEQAVLALLASYSIPRVKSKNTTR